MRVFAVLVLFLVCVSLATDHCSSLEKQPCRDDDSCNWDKDATPKVCVAKNNQDDTTTDDNTDADNDDKPDACLENQDKTTCQTDSGCFWGYMPRKEEDDMDKPEAEDGDKPEAEDGDKPEAEDGDEPAEDGDTPAESTCKGMEVDPCKAADECMWNGKKCKDKEDKDARRLLNTDDAEDNNDNTEEKKCNKYKNNVSKNCPTDRCEVVTVDGEEKCKNKAPADDTTDDTTDDKPTDEREEMEMCFTDPCKNVDEVECKKDDKCVFNTDSGECIVSPCSQKMDREGCGEEMMCSWVKVSMEMDEDAQPEDEKNTDSKEKERRFLGDDTENEWSQDFNDWDANNMKCSDYTDKGLCQSKQDECEWKKVDGNKTCVEKEEKSCDKYSKNNCPLETCMLKKNDDEKKTCVEKEEKSCDTYGKNNCPEETCMLKNKTCVDREDDEDKEDDDYGMCIVDNCSGKTTEDACQEGCVWGTKPVEGAKDKDGEGSTRRLLDSTKQCMVDGCPMLNKMDCGDSKMCNYSTEMKKCYYDECAMKSEDDCTDKCVWTDEADKPTDMDTPAESDGDMPAETMECGDMEIDACKTASDCKWSASKGKCKDNTRRLLETETDTCTDLEMTVCQDDTGCKWNGSKCKSKNKPTDDTDDTATDDTDDTATDDAKPAGRCMRRMEDKDCDGDDCEGKNFSDGEKFDGED